MNYYIQIKEQLINNEITKKVKNYSINRSDLNTYYEVGKILSKAGKHYGEGIIKEYSKRLSKDLGKGYSPTRLRYFRRFYEVCLKCPSVMDKLTFTHYCEIIWYDEAKMNYYIRITEQYNLSVRELRKRIKQNEYERLPEITRNKLIKQEKPNITDLVKDPVLIKNSNNYEIISEKILQKLILENIPSFLKELGEGFTFIDNEYKIKIGNTYNYIDLLLFNIKFNCYVVIELKTTSLKKEYIGQIEVYMNYIDIHLKQITQDKTIGIIIVKENNKYVIKYSSDKRIISREYELV